MSILLSILLLWFGASEPNEVAADLRAIGFDHIADPVDRWRLMVAAHFPEDEVETALCIIEHESKGDPDAENPRSSATGLFQILGSLWGPIYGVTEEHLLDPALNVRIASHIWEQSGWRAWTTDRICR